MAPATGSAPHSRRDKADARSLGRRVGGRLCQTRDRRYVGTSQTIRNPSNAEPDAPWNRSISPRTRRRVKLNSSHAPVSATTSAPRATVCTTDRPRSASSSDNHGNPESAARNSARERAASTSSVRSESSSSVSRPPT